LEAGRVPRGTGTGPLSALAEALDVDILHYAEHATDAGRGSRAMAYAEVRAGGVTGWGAGQDTSVLTASVRAVLSAVNRLTPSGT
ncbi:MAG: 2-isopropylmalate synthase, partial [Nonomuraea sp.]|nr:2-isopropylmalate synthase [Nonomuraea sp.]